MRRPAAGGTARRERGARARRAGPTISGARRRRPDAGPARLTTRVGVRHALMPDRPAASLALAPPPPRLPPRLPDRPRSPPLRPLVVTARPCANPHQGPSSSRTVCPAPPTPPTPPLPDLPKRRLFGAYVPTRPGRPGRSGRARGRLSRSHPTPPHPTPPHPTPPHPSARSPAPQPRSPPLPAPPPHPSCLFVASLRCAGNRLPPFPRPAPASLPPPSAT